MDYFRGKRFLDTLPDWERGRPHQGPVEDYLPRMRALLARLGQPQAAFRSLIVGGTNGKGTVSSLLAALLQASGLRVGLYTSPHLHSQRERIRLDGQLLTKDRWADGLTELYDHTRDFEAEGRGPFSRFEALTGLAALLFQQEGAEVAVFEVGLGGRYDATNAWDSEAAAITAIGLDHTEVLGPDLETIAADKLCIARSGRPMFTTSAQPPAVLDLMRRQCRQRGIPLFECGDDGVAQSVPKAGPIATYPCDPTEPGQRPATFIDNARLALAVAGWATGGASATRAAGVVAEHRWPGRFERAREDPLVILDGAHNPAAAVALAVDLAALAPAWTFVVGALNGHDTAGVLQGLAPLARRLVLTAPDHPRALAPAALERLVPAGVEVEVVEPWSAALGRALAATGPGEAVCVTGTLQLVARAREFFDLPTERDGVTEDVALESLACVQQACHQEGRRCQVVSDNGHVVRVEAGGRPVYFMRNKHPFNDYVAARLAEDKGYQQELFTGAGLPIPRTIQVFNPLADERFNRYKTHGTVEEMAADIEAQLEYPVVVKKYRSSLSQGVYLEHNGEALRRRLQSLFENAGFLDNTVLVQEFVAGPEYRIVATQDELLLAYEKQSEGADSPSSDLNPLHHSSGRAVGVEDPDLLASMARLTGRVAEVIDLGFYAIDLIAGDPIAGDPIARDQELWILELNPNPFCYFYNRTNGRGDFVNLYRKLMRKYLAA